MSIRTSAEDASWALREAAWDFEERLLWRGSDTARGAARGFEERVLWPGSWKARRAIARALKAVEPLHRLIQTRIWWPLGDRLEDYGVATRTALATAAVAAAVAAGSAGAMLASGGESPSAAPPLAEAVPVAQVSDSGQALRGVTPDFAADESAKVAGQVPPPPPPPGEVKPTAPPARIALGFAQAFVQYEIGEVDEQTAATFASTADPALAQSLSTDPPRLPAGNEVPKARVLNVVLAEPKGKEVVASVSLLRLKAASELRLTLRNTADGWRVVEVLG